MRRAGELSGGREEQIQAETENEGMTGADLLSLYLEELKQIPTLEAEEEAVLLEKLRAGDARARKRLTEGYLGTALAEIQPFVGSMEAGELIGVANLALTAALCDEKILESTVLRDTIKQKVHTALEEAVRENRQSDTGEQTLADRMNALTELSSKLAAELGREASPEELASRLDIPLDEVQRLLAMSMQALE